MTSFIANLQDIAVAMDTPKTIVGLQATELVAHIEELAFMFRSAEPIREGSDIRIDLLYSNGATGIAGEHSTLITPVAVTGQGDASTRAATNWTSEPAIYTRLMTTVTRTGHAYHKTWPTGQQPTITPKSTTMFYGVRITSACDALIDGYLQFSEKPKRTIRFDSRN